ncbi:MAG TPA: hypothetical protein VE863_03315 [Pyrinomonadaceae bacterium]|jgi:hypothetical protein|nr:hypothetical protein [Pyrinomonadaceae bacterium]
MRASNFCSECGERVQRNGWRVLLRGSLCAQCAARLGRSGRLRSIAAVSLIAIAGFAIGRYLRPTPPPLIILRAANSPLSDAPIDSNDAARSSKQSSANSPPNVNLVAATTDAVYICGARTKKGTPCQRRVHVAGERCFQHKGMAAMVPLEKLKITPER